MRFFRHGAALSGEEWRGAMSGHEAERADEELPTGRACSVQNWSNFMKVAEIFAVNGRGGK